jgi:hypothetical protein
MSNARLGGERLADGAHADDAESPTLQAGAEH